MCAPLSAIFFLSWTRQWTQLSTKLFFGRIDREKNPVGYTLKVALTIAASKLLEAVCNEVMDHPHTGVPSPWSPYKIQALSNHVLQRLIVLQLILRLILLQMKIQHQYRRICLKPMVININLHSNFVFLVAQRWACKSGNPVFILSWARVRIVRKEEFLRNFSLRREILGGRTSQRFSLSKNELRFRVKYLFQASH